MQLPTFHYRSASGDRAGACRPGIQDRLGSVLRLYPCLPSCAVHPELYSICVTPLVLTTALGGRSFYANLPHITDKEAKGSRDGLIPVM